MDELRTGEFIVWKGTSQTKHLIGKEDIMMSLVGLVATVIMLVIMFVNYPVEIDYSQIPIIIFAQYWVFIRYFLEIYWRKKTTYAITNQKRVFVYYGNETFIIEPEEVKDSVVTRFSDGSIHVIFKSRAFQSGRNGTITYVCAGLPGHKQALVDVEEGDKVLALLEL